jgi:hypothetical protein
MKHENGLTPEHIYDQIKDYYPKERACSVVQIDKQCMSMKGSGLVDAKEVRVDDEDRLTITYAMTEYGADLARKWLSKYM